MAHQRSASSISASGSTHAISLKVLRLSRPQLATQTPLPITSFNDGLDISPTASRDDPIPDVNSSFPLTPLLTLPSAFGAAYVGEIFSCTLCANNEIKDGAGRSASGVRIVAELQTPSEKEGIELQLESADGEKMDVRPGGTLQRTLRHDLKEEGPYVLAVTVTYTETLLDSDGGASGGRVRSFRKLYQFVAQQLIAIRSKVTERKTGKKSGGKLWVLEAQLENLGETSAVLERLELNKRDGVKDSELSRTSEDDVALVLKPGDVEQVIFLLEEGDKISGDATGRVPLAQLVVHWRSAMGERGSLTTGWLASRGP